MKNPSGLCMCGCGQKTPLSPASRRGYKRGEPLRFIKGHSSRKGGPDYRPEDRGFETECWIWCKSMGSEGYGRIWINLINSHNMAHRVYWERATGETVPPGFDLHHLCSQRACVNPAHLKPLSRRDHMAAEGRQPYGNRKAAVNV